MPLRRKIRLRPRAGNAGEPGEFYLPRVQCGSFRLSERVGAKGICRVRTGAGCPATAARAHRFAPENFPRSKTRCVRTGICARFKILFKASWRFGGGTLRRMRQAHLPAVHERVRFFLLAAVQK